MSRPHVLRIDSSARRTESVSRQLTDAVIARLSPAELTVRDLAADPLGPIDESWIEANLTAPDRRSAEQAARLSLSDTLIAELQAADSVVIGLPVYNFGVPSGLKMWIDLVARAGITFRYTENGPQGLLTGKRAILVMASGGTEAGSEIDFATRYMRHVLGFLGISEVELVSADRMAVDPEATRAKAEDQVGRLAA